MFKIIILPLGNQINKTMIRKLIALVALILVISSCSNNTKKGEKESEVIYEQENLKKTKSEKEELKNTIQNLQKLNAEQKEKLEFSKNESSDKIILEEQANTEKKDLKKTVHELKELNQKQKN